MSVPRLGGVPAGSITWAMISAVPLSGSAVAADVKVMVDPDGASSGTLSQATLRPPAANRMPNAIRVRDIIETLNILLP